jgi:NarL family two-component system sensor histidine kinase LiaS
MQLGAARVLMGRDPQAAQTHVAEAEHLAQQAGAELSLLIHELRPVALGDKGLAEAVAAYARDWSRQTQIGAELHVEGEDTLPPATEHALLRIVQEALANVARHSGATAVTINLTYTQDGVTLIIADNGRGFDVRTNPKGVGLASIRERAAALGGRFAVQSQIGRGTTIVVHSGGADV